MSVSQAFPASPIALGAPSPERPIMVVSGTRPETIKLCPVMMALRQREIATAVCVTGQHREMASEVLDVFGLRPDFAFDVLRENQQLPALTAALIAALGPLMDRARPRMVLVQGDTNTALCAALTAFYLCIPVAHVEAGVRTFDPVTPFPEEMNRLLISRIATWHFAATEWAAQNLKREGVPAASILVSGNPGIDAVLLVAQALAVGRLAPKVTVDCGANKLILVTAHRRESFGEPLEHICQAVRQIAQRRNVQVVWPVHPNPQVQRTVSRLLGPGQPSLLLTAPLDYVSFVDLMRRAHFLLTDSGGIQEEGTALGRPVLVMREKTDRPEAVLAGSSKLVHTEARGIVEAANLLLDDRAAHARMASASAIYGDGRASARIADCIAAAIRASGVPGPKESDVLLNASSL